VTPITDFAANLPKVPKWYSDLEGVMSTKNTTLTGPSRAPSHYFDEWVQNTRSRAELTMLSDRELSDIGLERTYWAGGQQVSLHFISPKGH